MTHWPTTAMFAVVLVFMATITFAGGPNVGSSGSLQGQIRDVNPRQGLIVLQDGTELRAYDFRQIEGLRPGMQVRVFYDESFGRKTINRLEVGAPSPGR